MSSDQKREKLIQAVVTRAPGKRQIKPNAAIFENSIPIDDNDEEDEDFMGTYASIVRSMHDSGSEGDASGSDSGAEESSSESGGSDAENEDEESGGSVSDDEGSDELNLSTKLNRSKRKRRNTEDDDDRIEVLDSEVQGIKVGKTPRINGLIHEGGREKEEEKISSLICAICLNLKASIKSTEIIQCDKCGIAVHENCYVTEEPSVIGGAGVNHDAQSVSSSASTEPWFCEPCMFGENSVPHCELCPSRFGAFKRADVGGGWVHLTCALFIPGISFADVDHLTGVSWQEVDYKNFGRKPCVGCSDRLEARTGITVQCDAGLCKNFYHVSCAKRLGLLIDVAEEGHSSQNMHPTSSSANSNQALEPNFILCKKHNHSGLLKTRREAYAHFLRQENRRMATFNRTALDTRQENKRRQLLQNYLERMKRLDDGLTIVWPTQKRTKMLHTNAQFLNAFAEKAELLGIQREQFENEFTTVPPSFLPSNLQPAFTGQFAQYFEYRDSVAFAEEEKRLQHLKEERETKKKEKCRLEALLKQVQEKQHSKTRDRRGGEFHKLLNRFQSAIAMFLPTIAKSPLSPKSPKSTFTMFQPRQPTATKSSPVHVKNKRLVVPLQLRKSEPNKPVVTKKASINYLPLVKHPQSQWQPSKKSQPIAAIVTAEPPKTSTPSPPPPPKECFTCKKGSDQHLLTFCDTCHHYYHIGCLDPPLTRMPLRKRHFAFECSNCAYPSSDEEEDKSMKAEELDIEGSRKRRARILSLSGSDNMINTTKEFLGLDGGRPKRQRRENKILSL